jgi:uncharacterized protein YbjT (DUF2867 family)
MSNRIPMHTMLGAGGAIGLELLKELAGKGQRVRLVGRNPKPAPGAAEVVAADLSNLNQTVKAVSGSDVVYLLVGLKYDLRIWQEAWPKIMSNAIEACKRAKARRVDEIKVGFAVFHCFCAVYCSSITTI